MNRALLTKLHLIFAALMFPAVLMFLVTGGLYTWGNKGEWHEEKAVITLAEPLAGLDEGAMKSVVLAQLQERDIATPSGKSSINGDGADTSFTWTGARSDVKLSTLDDPLQAEVTIKSASLHRWLVQLHKGKGSTVFKVYATFLAITLLLLVLSGIIMGLQVKALRRITIVSMGAGAAVFVGFVLAG